MNKVFVNVGQKVNSGTMLGVIGKTGFAGGIEHLHFGLFQGTFKKLSENINSPGYDFMPFIEPNENYLLFCSQSPEGFPSISPDGKYFFFCREGKFGFNPYWISADFIEELRPERVER